MHAQQYLIAHKQQLGGKSKGTVQPRRAEQIRQYSPNLIRRKDAKGRYSATVVKAMYIDNWNVLQRRVQARIRRNTPVSKSSQRKPRAIVAESSEDGEEALTCVKVVRTRSKGNLMKSATDLSTSNDRGVGL